MMQPRHDKMGRKMVKRDVIVTTWEEETLTTNRPAFFEFLIQPETQNGPDIQILFSFHSGFTSSGL